MLESLLYPTVAKPSQVEYTTPGTYYFVVPNGVERISAVGIGAGGGGWNRRTGSVGTWGSSGCGGSLRWVASVAVTPGETLTIVVGAPGASVPSGRAGTGGNTTLMRGSEVLLRANGGTGGGSTGATSITNTNAGGIGDGGGNGGNPIFYWEFAGGGAGAGGYTGNGGNGSGAEGTPSAGTGGAGGGGFGVPRGNYPGTGGRGGGVGLLGSGNNGASAGRVNNTNGGAGSQYPGSGEYGAGASASGSGYSNIPALSGALRIVWGEGRQYPNYVPDV